MRFDTKIRLLLLLLGFFIFSSRLSGQEIKGFVIDSVSKQPLAYVNIGAINISKGTITNEKGEYILDSEKLPKDCKIQVSMIGYETQIFDLNKLKTENKTIRLVKRHIALDEVTIKWKDVIKKVGATKTSKMAGVCGWGGTQFGEGRELGLLLKLGNEPVRIENLNLKIHKHSFDTIVFRLHIRSIKKGLPFDELLTENIYFPITNLNGWEQIDLSAYNILVGGDVALSIEWIKISNVIEKNLIKMNGAKKATPNILFKMSNKNGTFFIRNGSADKWRIQENSMPGFYITIKE